MGEFGFVESDALSLGVVNGGGGGGEVGRRSRPHLHLYSPPGAWRSHHPPDEVMADQLGRGGRIAARRAPEAVKSGAEVNAGGAKREPQ